MPFEFFVAFRYLWGKRRSLLVGFITLISVAGVVLGVAALNITLAVMTGFEEDLKSKILGMNSHAVVLKFGGVIDGCDEGAPEGAGERPQCWQHLLASIREREHVQGATPFTYNEVMLQSDSGVTGAILKGADPATAGDVTDLIHNICVNVDKPNECGRQQSSEHYEARKKIFDQIEDMHPVQDRDKPVPGILLGRELAESLLVLEGELVRVVAPSGAIGPGGSYPKMKTFKVVGTFKTGMWEYDTKFAFVSIPAAQKVSGDPGGVTGVEIKVQDAYAAPRVSDELEQSLGYPYTVKDWIELNGALFGALKLEKIVMGLLLSIILIVASFCIIAILTIIVLEKRNEIAILKTIGAANGMVLGVFAVQGLFIGVVGTIIGTGLGYVIAKGLQLYHFPLDTRVYYLDSVPVILEPANFVVVAGAAVAISLVAALVPSGVGALQPPVEGLRHE